MRIALFCHSLLSDWNHGNAHFLRGIVAELAARDHEVRTFEPRDAWSVSHLVAEHGECALEQARQAFPWLDPVRYEQGALDLDAALDGCALVLVHEWNNPALVRRIGQHRRRSGRYRLLFHDTHHRSVTEPDEIARFDLSAYDGVLAFGEAVREQYLRRGWARRVWTWHEAADTRTFFPRTPDAEGALTSDEHVVWIGNWGDDERTRELEEYLLAPVRALSLRGTVFGVRYPDDAKHAIGAAGLRYGGWLPNHRVPDELARRPFTVHVPRRAYVQALPGIPTIRPFEAMACGAPLLCAPWNDAEGLFEAGKDYLLARSGEEMRRHMLAVLEEPSLRRELGEQGRATVLARHTCAHRTEQLLGICSELGLAVEARYEA
jgi:spore maturation protein CgeB